MTDTNPRTKRRNHVQVRQFVVLTIAALVGGVAASAQTGGAHFHPGNLVVSRSVYDNNPNNVQVGEILPPNSGNTEGGCSGPATYDGTYPYVWNNALVDGSFGITSKLFLDQLTPAGLFVNSLEVPNSTHHGTNGDGRRDPASGAARL